MRSANIVLELFCILICLILAVYHFLSLKSFRVQKCYFIGMLLANIGMMLGDMTDWFFNGVDTPLARTLAPVGMSLFYALSGPLLLFLLGYFLVFTECDAQSAGVIRGVARILCVLQILFSVLTIWTGWYFYFTEENVYVRGELFLLSQMIPVVLYLLGCAVLFYGRSKMGKGDGLLLVSYIILPCVAQLLQVFFYGGAYLNTSITVVLILVNINVQREQEFAEEKAKRELADMQVSLMLSQIKPHFLYNSLTAIRQLCDIDAGQAKESLLDFSRFLRANMNSLDTTEPIPFERELEHVRSYLNLEKQRFGEKLHVIYDIQTSKFLLPTLTLQPIVENAVRHGILRREEGGTLLIHTEDAEDGYLICVEDDGVGMEYAAEKDTDGRIGIGMINVKKRLETQCGGDLYVHSESGRTRVMIWIPKKKKRENKV
ncbi:MAG: histidine kinase [Eubacteriales bacterium]|nr:histidine kinase [Eubacteriales bacterium]